jgi:hypothetical protein
MEHTHFTLAALGIAVALFIAMVIFFELGRRLGVHMFAVRGQAARAGVGSIDSAVFGLLALLIGFTFSGATSRFDARRQLVIQEVDAVSTAWERIDVLPDEGREPIRAEVRRYVDALLTGYANPNGSPEEERAHAAATSAHNDLWSKAVVACTVESGEKARMLLLPALNDMFSAVDTERLNEQLHPPLVIYLLLGLSAMAAALFGGYSIASGTTRDWFHVVGVAATISLAMWVILELEFPRNGLVRISRIDSALVQLRATMK